MASAFAEGPQQTRLLVIDDDEKLGRLLRGYLEPFGFVVDLAHTGKDGVERAPRGDYAAVILDVMLPDTSGFEVLREIRKQTAVPVLMLTALGDEQDRIAGLDTGADDYLPKTFSTNELLARLRAVLRRSDLATRQQKELEREKQELDQALEIQRALLPTKIPHFAGYEIAGAWLPSKTVSGDYYDVLTVGQNKIAMCIGDVSGKGMPAALLMANVQSTVKIFAPDARSPAQLCGKVNSILCGNLPKERFVTFFYGVIDPAANRLTYTCAGHNPPFLIRRNGSEMRLDKGGTVLGLFPKWEYVDAEVELGPGDRLLLFTDGVTEAVNPEREEFGEERLFKVLRDQPGLNAEDLLKAVLREVSTFCGGSFDDDVTLVTLCIAPR